MAGDLRKPLSIEQLLQWAYVHEIPKGYERPEGFGPTDASISPMFRLAALGTRIDFTAEPGFPAALGQPHPDALMIDAAVQRLPAVGLDWRQSRPRLMPDLLHFVDEHDPILSAMSFAPHALLVIHAKMGTRPIWDLGPPRLSRVIGSNGKPVIQYIADDGTVALGRTESRHYGPFAHCPMQLSPPAREIACARAEYFVWHQAMERVRETLCAWTLHDHRPLPAEAAAEPWIVDTEPKRRILRSSRLLQAIA